MSLAGRQLKGRLGSPRKGGRGGSQANWPLRLALVATFTGLVAGSSIVASLPSAAPAEPTVPPTTPTTSVPAKSKTTTTTIPGRSPAGPVLLRSDTAAASPIAPPLSRSPKTASRRVGRCTVIEIGDSLGSDLGWGLERHLATTSGLDLIQLDKPSTGLANSWYYNWPVNLAAALKRYRPQLVLLLLGGNDQQGMKIRGSVVNFGTSAWEKDYVSYVREIVTEATSSGTYVLWIGLPIMQPPTYSAGTALLDSLYKEGVTSGVDDTFSMSVACSLTPRDSFSRRLP